jgi:hypothetical protein
MQLLIPLKSYDNNNVVFCNKTDNIVIPGGNFYKLMYCNKNVSMLGVHILFEIDISSSTASSTASSNTTTYLNTNLNSSINHKYNNKEIINKINEKVFSVVSMIVSKIHNQWIKDYDKYDQQMNPITLYNIEQAVSKAIETYKTHIKQGVKIPFVLKCSGIYETDCESGVSFRLNHI